jgi:hypothetical protein
MDKGIVICIKSCGQSDVRTLKQYEFRRQHFESNGQSYYWIFSRNNSRHTVFCSQERFDLHFRIISYSE